MTGVADWTGRVGDVWSAEWRRTDRSFAALSRHFDAAILATAPPRPFRALDIGCGAGGTSLALATARPDATILGIDLSAGLIEVACERYAAQTKHHLSGQEAEDAHTPSNPPSVLPRRREPSAPRADLHNPGLPPAREHGGEWIRTSSDDRDAISGEAEIVLRRRPEYNGGVGNVRFETGDAANLASPTEPLDLLYSRHGVMFFDDPVAAFTSLHTAAKPGAKLVFSCFADWSDNHFADAIAEALDLSPPTPRAPGPFAFADDRYVDDILTRAGWTAPAAARVLFIYRAGEGDGDAAVADALEFFQRIGPAAGPLRTAPPADRMAMLDRLTDVLHGYRVGNAVDFPALAWIWSATA